MKRYDEKVLGYLLDTYERSLSYSGKNKVNRSIAMPVSQKTLPEYFDESVLQFDVIHQQLEQLEDEGYIRLVWKNQKKGHILEKCELVTERSGDAYRRLGRKPKHAKEQEILERCAVYQGKARELDCFLEWVRDRLQDGASIQRYVDVDEPREFDRLCQLIYRILTNDSECFLRQFSIRYFHDSKLAEKYLGKAVHVIAEFSQDQRLEELQEEEILAEYNIYRNPSWLMMKGSGRFRKVSGDDVTEISLGAFPGGLGISNGDLETVCWDGEFPVKRVVTVENLTSFHQWSPMNEEPVLCIYLGGYHNHVIRAFLRRLYEAYPHAEYRHFGDIDCGGFRIWKDLRLKTGIPFETVYMDLDAYEKYADWGRKLTEQDRKTLKGMMEDGFFEEQRVLFERMLERGVKVEQECMGGVLG